MGYTHWENVSLYLEVPEEHNLKTLTVGPKICHSKSVNPMWSLANHFSGCRFPYLLREELELGLLRPLLFRLIKTPSPVPYCTYFILASFSFSKRLSLSSEQGLSLVRQHQHLCVFPWEASTQEAVSGSAALWPSQEEGTEKNPGGSRGRKKETTWEVHLKIMTRESMADSLSLSWGEPSIPSTPFPSIPLIFKFSPTEEKIFWHLWITNLV